MRGGGLQQLCSHKDTALALQHPGPGEATSGGCHQAIITVAIITATYKYQIGTGK